MKLSFPIMRVFALSLCLASALGAAPAMAERLAPSSLRHAPPGDYLRTAEAVTLEQAVERIRNKTGGRVLSAETVVKDGRRVHRIKILSEGRVRVYYVDAGD